MKELYLDARLFTGPEEEFLAIDKFNVKQWYQNGKLHRVGGPAVIYPGAYQAWYKNGLNHRDGGPAVVFSNGSEFWYQNNLHHRLDGPALIYSDGIREWHMEGAEFYYFFNKFFPMKNFIKDKYPGE